MKSAYLIKIDNKKDLVLYTDYLLKQDYQNNESSKYYDYAHYIVIIPSEKWFYYTFLTEYKIGALFNIIDSFTTIEELESLFQGINMGLLESTSWNNYVVKINNKEEYDTLIKFLKNNNYESLDIDQIRGSTYNPSIKYLSIIPSQLYYQNTIISLSKLKSTGYLSEIYDTVDEFIKSHVISANKLNLLESLAGKYNDINNAIKQNNKRAKKGKVFKTLREYLKHLDNIS